MKKQSLLNRAIQRYKEKGAYNVVKATCRRISRKIQPTHLDAVAVELTNYCNLKCSFCFVDKTREQGYMSWPLFRKVVDEAAEIKNLGLGFNYGGESLLHPQFKKMLTYAMNLRNKGAFTGLTWVDNGMLFNHDIADLTVELGVDSIGFSIEGFADINDKIRIGCNYEKIKNNILYLLEKRGKKEKPVVRINTLNPANNTDFIKYWMQHADFVAESTERNNLNQLIHPEFFTNKVTINRCAFPFYYLGVFWNGKVTPCCSDVHGNMNIGDANKQTLKQIFYGKAYTNLRKHYNSPLCQTCDFWKTEFAPGIEPCFNGEGQIEYIQYWKRYRKTK